MLRLFAWAAAVLAVLLLSLGYTIATGGGQPDATPTPAESGSPEASPTGSAAVEPTPSVEPTPAASTTPAASSSGSASGFEIHAHEFAFEPAAITVAAAGAYTVTFVNDGTIPHNVTFADGTTISAQAGETVTGVVNVPAEGISFICSIPGHADAGMTGLVTVSGG